MSLTFNSALIAALKNPNVQLDFAYKFFYDDAAAQKYLGLCGGSDRILAAGSKPGGAPDYFYGVVTDHGEIVESIDLKESKASVGNITLTCANKLKNTTLAAELFAGTRKYINRLVKIYMVQDNETNLSNGSLIGNYRFTDIQSDLETCTITLEEWSPFDGIVIPNVKTGLTRGVYIPVIYGTYVQQDHNEFSIYGIYHPVPILGIWNKKIYCVNHQAEATNTKLAVYEPDWKVFATLITDNAPVGTSLLADQDLERSWKVRPKSVNAADEWGDSDHAIDDDGESTPTTEAYSIIDLQDTGAGALSATDDEDLILDFGNVGIGVVKEFNVQINYAGDIIVSSTLVGTPAATTTLGDVSYAQAVDVMVTMTQSGDGTNNDAQSNGTEINIEDHYDDTNTPPSTIIIRHTATVTGTGLDPSSELNLHSPLFIYDVWAEVTQELDSVNEPDASYKTLHDMKYMYSASAGYDQSYTDGSGIADDIHEVHRDIMYRFGGVDYDNNYMQNWTVGAGSVSANRAGYKTRLWLLEPTPLKEVLEQLQYEGGFIFKLVANSDGSGNAGGKYILVENSYSTPLYTLTNADYTGLTLSVTPLSELITKATYNYNRNPSTNEYNQTDVLSNTTARTAWNIGTNENAIEVDLDYLVDCGDNVYKIYDTGSTDGDDQPNDSIATYYDNILANPKIIVSCDVTNPQKFDIEIGDILQFSDAEVLPFGETWNTLWFMVVETRRTPSNLNITCREVYNT